MNGFISFLIVLSAVGCYFIPTIVGLVRKVTNLGSVAVVNFFLGWTVVGWIVALAMSVRTARTR